MTPCILWCKGVCRFPNASSRGLTKSSRRLGVGQYAGELSLLTGAQRNATIRAMEETEVVEIDQETFLQLIHEQPRVGLDIMRQLAHRLHETTEELILTSLEMALAQREPTRLSSGSRRMRFIATGSFASEKTSDVLRLAGEQTLLAKSPALVTSLLRPGRTQEALVYVLETDDPSDLLELIAPFMGLVQWDISPALELEAALAATAQVEDKTASSRSER